jgi:hypothetical protein
MKKALSLFSIAMSSVMLASAQNGVINIGVTAGTQGTANLNNVGNLIAQAQGIVTAMIPLAVGLGVVAFFWYLVQYIWKGGDSADNKTTSMKGMGYSILAIFVMVSIWGIVGLLGGMFGIGQGGSVPIPKLTQ